MNENRVTIEQMRNQIEKNQQLIAHPQDFQSKMVEILPNDSLVQQRAQVTAELAKDMRNFQVSKFNGKKQMKQKFS